MRGILVAVCLLTCVAACSGGPAPAPVATTPHTTKPAAPAFKSPDKVTAACPFAGVGDIVAAIGGVWGATAAEQTPEKDGPFTTFGCAYTSKYHDTAAFGLFIVTGPADRSPVQMVDDRAKGCSGAALPIQGVGERAVYCDLPDVSVDGIPEQVTTVIVGKHSHGESRLAELDLHRIRPDVYTKLATLLAGRL